MIKIYGMIVGSLLFAVAAFGQQESQYTQFVYHKQGLNPGFAGSQDVASLTALYRQQWMGLEGAPALQILSFNTPLMKNRVGFGVNITRNTLGIHERITGDFVYSYRIKMENGNLGLGVQASIRNFSMDYSDDRLRATDGLSSDGSIPVGQQNRVLPNFGSGLYFSNRKLYIGFSVPRLIRNNIDFNDLGGEASEEINHYYLMGGYLFHLSDLLSLQPQLLLKYAPDVPFDADFNLSLSLAQRYTIGLGYRLGGPEDGFGESLDFLVSALVAEDWVFGFSYDMSLGQLRDYNSGSIEALVQYRLSKEDRSEIINPRFF
ncbi:MAG: PorP/SprF family type IX secretion system membrane protein [Bacteroidota bacterium]